MKHSLWDKTIPRVVTAGAFAYLVYALVWKGEDLSYLHVLVFSLVVALVLVPFARRLKIPSVIDFESKLESLREETKKELGDIRNQISATIETQINPVQHQWTVIGMGEPLVKQLAQSITEEFQRGTSVETVKGDKYTRTWFLRKADSERMRAYDILFVAYHLQIALQQQRSPEELAIPFPVKVIDERINHMINHLLNGGVELFVPSSEVTKTSEGLKAIKTLLEVRSKVDSQEIEPPSQQETEELLAKIRNTIGGIIAGAILQGSEAIRSRYEIMQKIQELRARFGINDSPKKE